MDQKSAIVVDEDSACGVEYPEAVDMAQKVKAWCQTNKIPPDHGWSHFRDVAAPAYTIDSSMPREHRLVTILGCLLHDVDDPKIKSFLNDADKKVVAESKSAYPIAEKFLSAYKDTNPTLYREVLQAISLVSTSKNGNAVDSTVPARLYLVRDLDQLQALSGIGILRCYFVARRKGMPLVTADTPLPTTNDELREVLKHRTLAQYVASGGKSASMVDHFYDKLLLLQPSTGNAYPEIKEQFIQALIGMLEWLLGLCRVITRMNTKRNPDGRTRRLPLNPAPPVLYTEKSKLQSLVVTNAQLGHVAFGLNIEGCTPAHDNPSVRWYNLAIGLDHPVKTKKLFTAWQKEKADKKYPFLETVDPHINEKEFLGLHLATIGYLLSRSASLTVHVHQMQVDSLALIRFLRSHTNTMLAHFFPNGAKTVEWRTDDTFYAADKIYQVLENDELKLVDKKSVQTLVLYSISQYAMLDMDSMPGQPVVPEYIIPFDATENVIHRRKRHRAPNCLVTEMPLVMESQYYDYAMNVLLKDYQSTNPAKKDMPDPVKRTPITVTLLQAQGIWEPVDEDETVNVLMH